MVCPICRKSVPEEKPARPEAFPFCSDRCRLIDLGRWLSGKYSIPVEPTEDSPAAENDESDDKS